MKNFIFPQIFQPIICDNSFPSLQHWQNTSRRIQTQVQLTRENLNQSQKKSTQLNFLLKSFSTNLKKRTQNKIYFLQQGEPSEKQNINTRSQKQQKISSIEQSKSHRHYTIRISGPKSARFNINNKKNSRKSTLKQFKNLDFIKQLSKQNENKKKIPQTQSPTNQFKVPNGQIKKTNKLKINSKRKFQISSRTKIANNQIIQKKVGFNDMKSIASSKNILSKKHFTPEKRKIGVYLESSIEPAIHIKQSNKETNGRKVSKNDRQSKHQKMQEEISSQCPILQSFCSFVDQFDYCPRKRRMTFHVIQNSQKQIKQQKRSYTIWDLNKCLSDLQNEVQQQFQSERQNQRYQQQENKDTQKKIKKKVHFGRTSIQEKTMQQQIKQLIKQNVQRANDNKYAKFKGLISRSKRTDSIIQLQSTQSIGDQQRNRKIINNLTVQARKGLKIRKVEIQNVYNELNYLRMRLNTQKRNEQEAQISKPHPQSIILSVERVINEQQRQRIQKTSINNMMIDFGVRMTKDSMLKQRALKDRVKNFFI